MAKKNDSGIYPKPSMPLDSFYKLSIGQKVITRYMGPGIVIYPPIRYKHENGVVKVYRDTARVQLSRKCWDHLDPWEFPFHELTTSGYGYGD